MAAARTMTRERWDGAARASTRASRGCSHAYGREVRSWSARAGGCGNGVLRVRGGGVCGRRRGGWRLTSIDNTTGHHAPIE